MILGMDFTDQEQATPHRWIGGATVIYQKTIPITITTANPLVIAHGIDGFQWLIDAAFFLIHNTGLQRPVPQTGAAVWHNLYFNNTSIGLETAPGINLVNDGFTSAFITMWYIKVA